MLALVHHLYLPVAVIAFVIGWVAIKALPLDDLARALGLDLPVHWQRFAIIGVAVAAAFWMFAILLGCLILLGAALRHSRRRPRRAV